MVFVGIHSALNLWQLGWSVDRLNFHLRRLIGYRLQLLRRSYLRHRLSWLLWRTSRTGIGWLPIARCSAFRHLLLVANWFCLRVAAMAPCIGGALLTFQMPNIPLQGTRRKRCAPELERYIRKSTARDTYED